MADYWERFYEGMPLELSFVEAQRASLVAVEPSRNSFPEVDLLRYEELLSRLTMFSFLRL